MLFLLLSAILPSKRATDFTDSHVTWSVTLVKDTSISAINQIPPKPGDVIQITTTKPYRSGDYVEFTTQKADFNRS